MKNCYKHLYIIGNGFDIFTGLKTSYSDFKRWLEYNYILEYEALTSIYGADGDWWNDFENQLGNLNIVQYASDYPSKEKPLSRISKEVFDKEEPLGKGDGIPHLYQESPCAQRLEGLLDILQYCFEKWVQEEQYCFRIQKYTYIEKKNSFFINFNYTDTLERIYNISEDQVLHIHGRTANNERLVFGHNLSFLAYDTHNNDEQKIAEILSRYEKNPYYYIHHYDLLEIITNVEHIHILGFSFSDIDIPYLEWIVSHTGKHCDWEVSWYSEEDKRRINKFLLGSPQLKSRLHLIQIKEVYNN